ASVAAMPKLFICRGLRNWRRGGTAMSSLEATLSRFYAYRSIIGPFGKRAVAACPLGATADSGHMATCPSTVVALQARPQQLQTTARSPGLTAAESTPRWWPATRGARGPCGPPAGDISG